MRAYRVTCFLPEELRRARSIDLRLRQTCTRIVFDTRCLVFDNGHYIVFDKHCIVLDKRGIVFDKHCFLLVVIAFWMVERPCGNRQHATRVNVVFLLFVYLQQ
jgi:hypothetical protein